MRKNLFDAVYVGTEKNRQREEVIGGIVTADPVQLIEKCMERPVGNVEIRSIKIQTIRQCLEKQFSGVTLV